MANPTASPGARPSFKPPSEIPQDIAAIMEMVANDQVVGALPPVSMSAAEKRKLVEESMGANVGSDSDSSSEFESSSEEESEEEKPPMTVEDHATMKAELDAFVKSDSESDEDYSFPGLAEMGYEYMEDDEDEEDGAGPVGGGIQSTHETSLPPVQLPPMDKLPESEKVYLAGDVVSWMKEKKVEAWVEKQAAAAAVKQEETEKEEVKKEEVEEGEGEQDGGVKVVPEGKPAEPRFTSAGTIVVRAMQSRPQEEGWLEEGSILCWEDGRVVGTVHETFGPLTSPFYSIRLPPPPFPYPAPDSLAPGTKLFYPTNTSYRSFVNMMAVRDPRFKGTDASNLYDEEAAEEEMEWSDDEAEAAAKRARKDKKGKGKGKRASVAPGHASLPARPHFDFQPDDRMSETGSMYGGDENWEMGSDAGSTISGRGRPKPMPYDVDEPVEVANGAGAGGGGRGGRGRGSGRGRGEGQGRDRGRGRVGGQRGGRQSFPLPPNPQQQQQQQQQQPQYQSHYQPQFTPQFPFYPQMPFQSQPQESYEPNHPTTGMPMFPPQSPAGFMPQQGGVPAINPRFAAQYQMMMGMAQMAQGSYGQQGQGYGQQGQGGYGQQGQGGYHQGGDDQHGGHGE